MTLRIPENLSSLTPDGRKLFATRIARLFAYGFVSVILVFFLTEAGLSGKEIGWLFALTLVGDIGVSLWLTTTADRFGRRKTLVVSALLMVFAGVVFALTSNFMLLLIAATVGVISLSGNEIGPFLSVEQASLSQIIPDKRRTGIFAWYNLVGMFATALGSLAGGVVAQVLQDRGVTALGSYHVIFFAYAGVGLLLALAFMRLTPAVEVTPAAVAADGPSAFKRRFGLHRSKGTVAKLSALFSMDAFGGGFVIAGVIGWWFHKKFGMDLSRIGQIFFWANILAAISALSAAWMASKIGLIRTMVFTHVPSNILLILVPFMPNLTWAIIVLLLRFSISQMDVPTRQSYTMAVVAPDERSAASGVTGIARSVGAAAAQPIVGALYSNVAWLSAIFYIGGGMKLLYDGLLYQSFRAHRPPEENEEDSAAR